VTLQELFNSAIQHGIDADPRGRAAVEQELHEKRVSFDELKPGEQAFFDPEQLTNPYADSRVLHGSPETSGTPVGSTRITELRLPTA
jgi:hypothetical protein